MATPGSQSVRHGFSQQDDDSSQTIVKKSSATLTDFVSSTLQQRRMFSLQLYTSARFESMPRVQDCRQNQRMPHSIHMLSQEMAVGLLLANFIVAVFNGTCPLVIRVGQWLSAFPSLE